MPQTDEPLLEKICSSVTTDFKKINMETIDYEIH